MLDFCYFFNNFHIGDLVNSRVCVREAMKQIPARMFYCVHNYNSYFTDRLAPKLDIKIAEEDSFKIRNNILYFQTWYGHHVNYERNIETNNQSIEICHLEYQVERFSFFLKALGLPGIEYILDDKEKYAWDEGEATIDQNAILLSTAKALSGTSDNIDQTKYVIDLADEYKHLKFYISNPISDTRDNIIQIPGKFNIPAMVEQSKKCRVIAGLANGPLMSTWCRFNIYNPNKTYVALHNRNRGEAQFANDQTCKTVRVLTTEELFKEIRNHL